MDTFHEEYPLISLQSQNAHFQNGVRVISFTVIEILLTKNAKYLTLSNIYVVSRKMLKEKIANFLWIFLNMWMECWKLLFAVK